VIWLGRVEGLDEIEDRRDAVSFGAMVTHAEAMPYLAAIDRDLGELMRRFAGNADPHGGDGRRQHRERLADRRLPPALIALGATLGLQRGERPRTCRWRTIFLDYGKQDRQPGEFVRVVRMPKFGEGEHFRCYKISKRFDSRHFRRDGRVQAALDGTRIAGARIAFGGMAAIPKRARRREGADRELSRPAADWDEAIARSRGLHADRRSARERAISPRRRARAAAPALTEIGGRSTQQTRVVGFREAADVASA
jgi:xanthine dehydrogenase small subunit